MSKKNISREHLEETQTDTDRLHGLHSAWSFQQKNVRESAQLLCDAGLNHPEAAQMLRELRLFLELEKKDREAFYKAMEKVAKSGG